MEKYYTILCILESFKFNLTTLDKSYELHRSRFNALFYMFTRYLRLSGHPLTPVHEIQAGRCSFTRQQQARGYLLCLLKDIENELDSAQRELSIWQARKYDSRDMIDAGPDDFDFLSSKGKALQKKLQTHMLSTQLLSARHSTKAVVVFEGNQAASLIERVAPLVRDMFAPYLIDEQNNREFCEQCVDCMQDSLELRRLLHACEGIDYTLFEAVKQKLEMDTASYSTTTDNNLQHVHHNHRQRYHNDEIHKETSFHFDEINFGSNKYEGIRTDGNSKSHFGDSYITQESRPTKERRHSDASCMKSPMSNHRHRGRRNSTGTWNQPMSPRPEPGRRAQNHQERRKSHLRETARSKLGGLGRSFAGSLYQPVLTNASGGQSTQRSLIFDQLVSAFQQTTLKTDNTEQCTGRIQRAYSPRSGRNSQLNQRARRR